MSKSVVVIGAGGFIGRQLVDAIAAAGEHVIAAVRRDPGCAFAQQCVWPACGRRVAAQLSQVAPALAVQDEFA